MSEPLGFRIPCLVLGLAAVLSALWLGAHGWRSGGTLTVEQLVLRAGHAYQTTMPVLPAPFSSPTDTNDFSTRSTLRIFENDVTLGPPHALHAHIEDVGQGAFSDWDGMLVFSSSDGTDPRHNGRAYRYERELFLQSWLALALGLFGFAAMAPGLLRATSPLATRLSIMRSRWIGSTASRSMARARMPAGVLLLAIGIWFGVVGYREEGAIGSEGIQLKGGLAFSAELPSQSGLLVSPDDANGAEQRSTLQLFENGRRIGPAHTPYSIIEHRGDGAFTNWQGALTFSSSDRTDPRFNGKAYSYEQRYFFPIWFSTLVGSLGLLAVWPLARYRPSSAIRSALEYGGLYGSLGIAACLSIGALSAPRFDPALGADKPLESRVQYYLSDPKRYTAIFLGDSRTYCGIHPELIEKYVPEMKGINLASFAHWFPTQLSEVRDIVAAIPANTIVVWSVGHQNFRPINAIQRVYPISILDGLKIILSSKGKPPNGLLDNIFYYHWPLYLPVALQDARDRLQRAANAPFANWVITPAGAELRSNGRSPAVHDDVDGLKEVALAETDVASVAVTEDGGQPTSIIRYYRRGGYYRTELDPAFFRRKQSEFPVGYRLSAINQDVPPPDALYIALFRETLDLFASRRIKLVVNELEEAPFTYGDQASREAYRQFMRVWIQPEVERRGFVYARTDLDALNDDDYFDWDHLNSKGITKYTPMISNIIKALISAH